MGNRGLVLALFLAGCPGRSPSDEPGRDAGGADATGVADAATDGAIDASICPCNPDDLAGPPVLIDRACVAPLAVGCLAEACTVGGDECGPERTCQECAAAACCVCSACLPACVPSGLRAGPLPDYLKIAPTLGPADAETTIEIQGYPFYIGALFYQAQVGDSGTIGDDGAGATECSLRFTAPARGPGMVPVYLSQYGGEGPWVLAGFFTYSSGDVPACVQPGYACQRQDDCCQTAAVPMACAGGRCRTE